MAAPKRSKFQRERDLERTTSLYLRGWTQAAIAEELGVSREQIKYDLKAIQERWRKATTINLDEAKNRELARIDELERTYWGEWERSRKDKAGRRTKKAARAGEDGAIRTAESSEWSEERLGDPRYLAGVQWCIERRCKLLGLDAPDRTELTGRDGGPVETKEVGDDGLKSRLDRVLALLDRARERGGRVSFGGKELPPA